MYTSHLDPLNVRMTNEGLGILVKNHPRLCIKARVNVFPRVISRFTSKKALFH